MEKQIFRDLGFSDGEIKVYLALLELQESTIGEINKVAKVTPSKTYLILDKLKDKGLISYFIKNNVKHFQALNPEKLLVLIENREKVLEKKKKEIKNILPRLQKKKEARIQYSTLYEGFEGLKTLYDEAVNYCYKNKSEFLAFSMTNEEYEHKEIKYFFRKYDKLRTKLGINTKIIALENQKEQISNYGTIKFKFVNFNLPSGLIIWGDNVCYLTWSKNPTAFVIHSKKVANNNRIFFQDLWEKTK